MYFYNFAPGVLSYLFCDVRDFLHSLKQAMSIKQEMLNMTKLSINDQKGLESNQNDAKW